MPLLDHFRPPLDAKHHWESFHSNWATRLADQLNERLPEGFSAEENTRIDLFPESFEVRVFKSEGGLTLVGAIVLISPGHKGAPQERRAFAINCVGYLQRGISLILVDIVTSRRANLHDETVRLLATGDGSELGAGVNLYAVAYRPVLREES